MEMFRQAQKLEEHLAEVENRLGIMETMERDPDLDLPIDFHERLAHVRMLVEIAREKLNLAEIAGDAAWDGFHTGVEFACHEVDKAIGRIKGR
ncbi:MAG: hypothetical protein RL318_3134 [Fibrobacterota bacterium]|jgi:hypothetical protein